MEKIFEGFTNQYAVSKTLRFELIPQGKTMEFIVKKGLITQDEDRAEKYKKVKRIIDEYHKDFIEKALGGLKLMGLQDYVELYLKADKDDKSIKEFEKIRALLRKQIADAFKTHERYKSLFAKDLIRNELLKSCREEDKEVIKGFKDFTTYFVGFHQNRENMYVADEKATAVAYRLVHENLPKFIDNIKIFEKIINDAPEFSSVLNNVLDEMREIINGKTLKEIFSPDYFNETLTQKGIDTYNTIIGGRTPEEGKKKIKGLNEYINTDYNQQQTDKKKRLPRFKQLYKQILSDRQSFSFLSEAFQEDSDVLEGIEAFYSGALLDFSMEGRAVNVLQSLRDTVSNLESFDLSKIYFRSGAALTNVSKKIFDDWGIINMALEDYYHKIKPIGPRENPEKYQARKDKWLKQDFAISTLQAAINGYDNETVKEKNSGRVFADYFAGFCDENHTDLIKKIQERYNAIKDLLNTHPYSSGKKTRKDREKVKMIKAFLDSIMDVIHFVSPLSLKDSDKQKDEVFYSLFSRFLTRCPMRSPSKQGKVTTSPKSLTALRSSS
jgi:CRISPR-associated protein Cpf1